MSARACGVKGCVAVYPALDTHCQVCGEPNPIWEAREKEKSLIGYESARPFELTAWTGVPSSL